jgi:hypothetical protein
MKKIILIIAFFIFIFLVNPAYASNLEIECFGTGSCNKTGNILFSKAQDGYWFPGMSVSKSFKLINSYSESREVFIKPTRTSLQNILEDILEISLIPFGEVTPIWEGKVTDFFSLDNLSLGNISSGQNKEYQISVKMNRDADNSYQGSETVFDLDFSFWSEPSQRLGGPGDGLSDGRSDGLSDGGSNIVRSVLGVATNISESFNEKILGENDNTKKETIPDKNLPDKGVKGAIVCEGCFWWQILVVEAVLMFLHYFYAAKKKIRNKHKIGLILPILAAIIFLITNLNCNLTSSFWPCKYFLVFDFGVFAILAYFLKFFIKSS